MDSERLVNAVVHIMNIKQHVCNDVLNLAVRAFEQAFFNSP